MKNLLAGVFGKVKAAGFLLLVTVFSSIQFTLSAQSVNDFRTKDNGNWFTVSNWERFDGSNWTDATYRPGGAQPTGHVVILEEHSIQIPSTNETTTVPSLEVHGSLSLERRDFTVIGETLITGIFGDINNGGTNTFQGKFIIQDEGSVDIRGAVFHGGIEHTGNAAVSITLTTSFENQNQVIEGTGSGNLTFANVRVEDDVSLTNDRDIIITGSLDGLGPDAIFRNGEDAVTEYSGTSIPMNTGQMDLGANNNIFFYNANSNQNLKATDYFHLHLGTQAVSSNGNKLIEDVSITMNVFGNLVIYDHARLFNATVPQNLIIHGDFLLTNEFAHFYTRNSDVEHELTLHGKLINEGRVDLNRNNANRFTNLTITSDGEIITGEGVYIFRNLTLTNENDKSVNTSSDISFFTGNDIHTNHLLNDGGDLVFEGGAVVFRDTYFIRGTGEITFNNLTCGGNNQTIQTLEKDILVQGDLRVNHNNTLNSYLNLNGHTLTVIGNYLRSSSGELGATPGSRLVLGNGEPTVNNDIHFENGVWDLEELIVNSPSEYNFRTPLTVNDLNILSGTLNTNQEFTISNSFTNSGSYIQTSNNTFFDKTGGGIISISGGGNHTFWNMVIEESTTVLTSDDIQIHLHFTSNSNAEQGFVADAGTVFFSRNGNNHFLQGEGTGTVVFNNLIFNGTGNKFLARSFQVSNLFHINNGSSAVIDNSASHEFEFNNLTVGQGSSGRFITSGSGALAGTPHSLTIHGLLEVRSGGQFSLHSSDTRYAELLMTGSGTVLQGGGSFAFQSVTLTGEEPKNFSTNSTLNFYRGSFSDHHFTNNGGLFNGSQGLMYFRDHDTNWEIRGDGEIVFENMQIGANTRTNTILQRDLTVNGNLIFNMNTSSNHLDINGFLLTLDGNHTRSRNGRIRGGSGSELIIAGTGNHTSSFLFDETIDGQTNLIDSFIMDLEENGELRLGNLVYIENLQALNGTFNAFNGSVYVNEGGTAHFQQAYFIDNNNSGQNTFLGTLIIEEEAVFNPTANSVLNLGGNLNNMGEFLKEGSGNVNFIENTIIQGEESFYFLNGNLFISDNITVINQVNTDTIGVLMNGRLNGTNSGSVWDNRSFLTYQNGNEPMTTGQLLAVHSPNTVMYSREDNDQNVKGTAYHHLVFTGSGNRSMQGHLSVNGDMVIDENTTLLTREFQITGNPTGKLIMREESEMVIGRNTAQIAGFPELFTRENIELDPISLVRYDGQVQTISHIPVYSNLAITRASGNKTLDGDVTVNGYLHITTGTLAFGSDETQILTVYGDLVGAGGRVNMTGGAHPHEMHLYGTVNQVNRFNYAPGTKVRYLASQPQQIFSPHSSDHYSILEIAGGSTKWLEDNIRINDELRLTSGRLRLGEYNLMLFDADVTGDFGPNAMVETNGEGFLEKRGSGYNDYDYLKGIYPVGSGGRYSPVWVHEIEDTGNSRYFRVKAVPERHQSIVQSYDALVRFWEIETDAGNGNVRMDMYFSPVDVIGDPALYKTYKWTGSEFINYDDTQVHENYIEFTQPLPVEGQWTAFDDETIRETFYSYMDGPWGDPDTWTTDPSGQLLIGSQVPGASDNAVILPGRTVHLEQNIDAKGINIEIRNSAILDLGEYVFTQVVSTLKGEGTLKLATNQMPLVALNLFVQPEGGTVEYNVPDASFELNEQEHYNHLTINLPDASNKAILVNDLEVFGNLRVEKGILQIFRDDTSDDIHIPVIVDVYNDIHVDSQGAIFAGTASTSNGQLPPHGTFPGSLVPRYYDIYHKLYVGGGFYNNGQVRFFSEEITVPDFENLTDRGAVTVRFYGDENAVIECNGLSDFYNLIIDKGEGPAAEMELVAEQPHFFRLFGANVYNAGSGGNNPEVRKALWLRNGTLRLTGNTTLASLTEGRGGSNNSSWFIPANAALILDSPGATVLVSADTPNEVEAAWGVTPTGVHKENFPQELLVLGSLIVNQGYLSTRMSGGIIIARAGGEVIVNGGKISARQIRSADQGGAVFSFTGGEIELPGRYHHLTEDISSIEDIRNTPIDFETDNTLRL
ncbi:MAG: hypothetical protein EA393_16645, partial [Bacteroidetes bacterium]